MKEFILSHAAWAPWIIFFAILPAAFCLPISIDLLLIVAVIVGTTLIPESLIALYIAFVLGCLGAAWIAYWMGRFLGDRVTKVPLLKKYLHHDRLDQMANFYQKWGTWTLIVGRFIPFGVRNLIFYSSGISRMNFAKFAIVDTIACICWSALFFFSFVYISENFEVMIHHMKRANLIIFSAFSVTVIGLIWYKCSKFKRSK